MKYGKPIQISEIKGFRQLSFSTSQRVKRKICVQKVVSSKEQKLSLCTGKQNYVIKMKSKDSSGKNKALKFFSNEYDSCMENKAGERSAF